MTNKESQPNDKTIDEETSKERRFGYTNETQSDAVESEGSDSAEEVAASETAAAPTLSYSTAAGSPPAGENHSVSKKSSTGWIILSAALAVALIVTLIFPPFGNGSGGNNEAVATVNGADITKDELYDLLASMNGESAVENLIVEKLVQQELDAASITFTDDDVTEEIALLKLEFGSEEEFTAALEQYGYTTDSLREDFRLSAMIRKAMTPQINITDEAAQAYFNENQSKFGGEDEQVRASHIIVETKEEAEAILAELKGGADFATLAAEKSIDGSAANGGDLDFFNRAGMVAEFSDAAFALEVGELSDVVQSSFGFHIIKKTDYKAGKPANFEENSDLVHAKLVSNEVNTSAGAWIEEIRTKAKITNTFDTKAAETPDTDADTNTTSESK